MEERTFSWFPKLTRVMASLPPEHVAEFAMAVANYGTNGVEPAFENPLMAAVFEGVRMDIDNSLTNKYRNKGGRPPKNPRENGGSEVSETSKTPVSENKNPTKPVSETGNPSYISNAMQCNATKKEPSSEGSKKAAFAAPTHDEVAAYAAEKGLALDAGRFVDYFAAQGWKLSNGNRMRDWRAAVRNWCRNDSDWAKPRGGGDHDPVYSAL